jgi:hypothetical protein
LLLFVTVRFQSGEISAPTLQKKFVFRRGSGIFPAHPNMMPEAMSSTVLPIEGCAMGIFPCDP